MKALLNKQKEAIEKLAKYKAGALFMHAGTGKTRTAIELINSTNCDFVLWVCPCQAKENIATEFSKWGFKADIIGIESLQCSDRIYLQTISKIKKYKKVFLIVDESLKIKNKEAKRTSRLLYLASLAEFRLILNGTPLTRNILDMWSQMEFLSPKILNMPFNQYKNTFCEWVEIKKYIGRKYYKKEFIKDYHNLDYLSRLINPFVYECDLELEVKQNYHNYLYNLDTESIEEYYKLKNKFLDNENLLIKNNNIFLEMTQKMQGVYCIDAEKFELVASILQKESPKKTIIFCKFIKSAEAVSKIFKDCKVLTYGKHSFSLNLQEYNCIIYFDKTWDYAQRKQSSNRIYRQGQSSDCQYYDLTGRIGLENLINQNIENKISMVEYFKKISNKELKKVL